MEQFIHYIDLTYFQQPIRAMQFNAAELQKQSRFKSCFKKLQKLAVKSSFFWSSFKKQRSSSYAAIKSAAYVWTHLHADAAQLITCCV